MTITNLIARLHAGSRCHALGCKHKASYRLHQFPLFTGARYFGRFSQKNNCNNNGNASNASNKSGENDSGEGSKQGDKAESTKAGDRSGFGTALNTFAVVFGVLSAGAANSAKGPVLAQGI
ncbi:hypothetical protein IWW45_008726, partial [Coemansia sp. RSA 485]